MKEGENALEILNKTLNAIQNENPQELKELSDKTIHSVSTTGDEDNLAIAVIVYSLGKIFSRKNYRTLKGWNSFNKIIISSLKNSIQDLENQNYEKFKKDFVFIRNAINKVSGKLKDYIEDVFKKAEINKASRIHEHGISSEKTAKMLGITLFDLQGYIGQTEMSDAPLNHTINIKSRIKLVENLFK